MGSRQSSKYNRIHVLKTETEFFDQVKNGFKKFELRKNDRGFRNGDFVLLYDYKRKGESLSMESRVILVQIEYIVEPNKGIFGTGVLQRALKKNHCIFCWRGLIVAGDKLKDAPFDNQTRDGLIYIQEGNKDISPEILQRNIMLHFTSKGYYLNWWDPHKSAA